MVSLLKHLFRRAPKRTAAPFNFALNRYPAHTTWPPNLDALEGREQFRLERKFRRRSKLKWARPVWNRNLSLVQWGSTLFVVTYVVFFVDWSGETPNEKTPQFLMGFREWYGGLVQDFWTSHSSEKSRGEVLYQQQRYQSQQRDTREALEASRAGRTT